MQFCESALCDSHILRNVTVDVDVGGGGGSLPSPSTTPPPALRRSSIPGAPPLPAQPCHPVTSLVRPGAPSLAAVAGNPLLPSLESYIGIANPNYCYSGDGKRN